MKRIVILSVAVAMLLGCSMSEVAALFVARYGQPVAFRFEVGS